MNLWLQVDPAGGVWTGTTSESRKKVSDSVNDFSAEKWNEYWDKEVLEACLYVNVYGIAQNASLLVKLYENLAEFGLSGIRLQRPPTRLYPAGLQKCNALLWSEGQFPPSMGGARLFTSVDAITCKLQLQAPQKNDHPNWDELLELVKLHPAWPVFSFLPLPRGKSAIRLIALLGDPRWYINPKRADSTQDLITAFGLGRDGLANMQTALNGSHMDNSSSRGLVCALNVLYSWCPVFLCEGEARLCQREDIDEKLRESWVLADYVKNSNPVDGLLIASRRFLRAVCNVWLDNLTPPRTYKAYESKVTEDKGKPCLQLMPAAQYSPELFIPGHEFHDNPHELLRWQEHIAKWRKESLLKEPELEAHEGTGN